MRISRRDFGRLVAQAVTELPQEVHDVLDNVNIMVQDWPSAQQLESGDPDEPHSLLGLYEGIPQVDRGNYNFALPDRITLFRRPLAQVCRSTEELLEEVRTTVVHEIAHHLGWSDEDLDRMGYA
jgi:predicted Zn-dependent protease with MMP-like domain